MGNLIKNYLKYRGLRILVRDSKEFREEEHKRDEKGRFSKMNGEKTGIDKAKTRLDISLYNYLEKCDFDIMGNIYTKDKVSIENAINKVKLESKESADILYNGRSRYDLWDGYKTTLEQYDLLTDGAQAIFGFSSIKDKAIIPDNEIENIRELIDNNPNNRSITTYRGQVMDKSVIENLKIGDPSTKFMKNEATISNITFNPQVAYDYTQNMISGEHVPVFMVFEDSNSIFTQKLSEYRNEYEGFLKTDDKELASVEETTDGCLVLRFRNKKGE